MFRSILRTFGNSVALTFLVVAGSITLYLFHQHNSAEYQLAELQQQKVELQQIIKRFQAERRVAKIVVTDQKTIDGKIKTTFLFVEYRRDGSAIPAREFTVAGNEVHFDGELIKFKDEYTQNNDALRGQSILLFTRIYGATQAPVDGFAVDEPGTIPEIYRGSDPRVTAFEQDLWTNFWKLYNDESARDAKGIRGLHGEGLFGQLDPDHVYTITLRADGGTLNEEPIDPIYRDAIRRK
ncbi:MAG: hypothetical protein M3O30_12780 [Planctomycetota bacterium]|nr:hypothetical protein [Planctomycetota bacterium]